MSGRKDQEMITITRTDATNRDFIDLVKSLDTELAERDGINHPFYSQYNRIKDIKYVVIAYDDGKPRGCGAIKAYGPDTMEIKRMYTSPESRGKGIATLLLGELEKWTTELSCKKCILETGRGQPEAIGLYKKNGYKLVPNYGQYTDVENSLCFEKPLA